MRTREPILAIGVCAVLALGGAGCGSDDNNDKSKESSSARGAGLLALSSSAQKITRVSANVGGLEGSTKPKSGKTTGLQPGDQLNLAGLPPNIIQTVKQQTGVDVQVQCPSSVTYSPGSVFYCQLTTPDGTAYQVECTQQPGGGVQWKVVTTQPTPPPPPGPSQQKLKGNTGKAKATGARKTGDALDISSLASNIETKVKQQTGLDVNVECPATVDYSPGSVFYCKLYTSDGTAYDVKCTQGQDGSISWEVLVGQTGKSSATSKFSSDAKKIASLSAKSHGLAARAKKRPGATGFSDGEQVDTKFVVDDIVKYFKEQKGIDVQVACPPQVQFALGAIFYCKLYAPDNTGYDVRVTWEQNGAYWEVLTTQPTPPPAPAPGKLKGTSGKGKTTGQAGPQPGDSVSTDQLEQQIVQRVKQQAGLDVTVDCPPTVTYAPGSIFYCKLMTADGRQFDVEVTQGENLQVSWKILTQPTQPTQP